MKKCLKCNTTKPISEFHKKRKPDSKDGLAYACKKCVKKYAIVYYARNRRQIIETNKAYALRRPGYQKSVAQRWRDQIKIMGKTSAKNREYTLNKYGMTQESFDARLKSQGGACRICKLPSKKILSIDHCHDTGEVRGLLCHYCNSGLGHFRDSSENLRAAADYIENFRPATSLADEQQTKTTNNKETKCHQ